MTLAIDHYHFPSLDSTNVWAHANVQHLKPHHLTVITAGVQTAGRGRDKRKWISPPDVNLYATYCIFVPKSRKDTGNIAQVIALTAAQLMAALGIDARLKWPNDILIEDKKVGGILGETTPHQDLVCVITGLGLNINMRFEDLAQIDRQATSLLVQGGHAFDLDKITEDLEHRIQNALRTFLAKGFKPFVESFRELMVHRLGDTMRFHVGSNMLEGSFHSINDNGTLNVILDDRLQTLHSGEIV